jgi:hypothetical protein
MLYGASMATAAVAGWRGMAARWLFAGAAVVAMALASASATLAAEAARDERGGPRDRDREACPARDPADARPTAPDAAIGVPAIVDALRDPPSIEDLETSYRLRVDLRHAEARLRVRERIDLCNRSDRHVPSVHLSVLARAFDEMRVDEVRVDGRRVTVSYPDAADMLVPLGTGLAPGDSATIDVDFLLRPSRSAETSLHESLSRSGGLMRISDWFPIVSDGHGLRLPGDSQVTAAARRITLDLRFDRRLDVAAPGTALRQEPRRHVYTMRNARDYAFAVAPRLTSRAARTDDGVRVEVMATDDGQAEEALRAGRASLERFHDAFGPYPWRRLVIAPTTSLLGGDEYPGIAFIGQAWLRGPESWEMRALRRGRPDRWFGVRYVVSHEAAHQWFYGIVGSDQIREPWLDEALAEFAAHHAFRPDLLTSCAERPVSWAVTDFRDRRSARGCLGYTETIYRGGAVMVDGVRRLMGDRAFFAAMRGYVRDHRYGIATADDLIGAWRARAWSPLLLDAHLARHLEDG